MGRYCGYLALMSGLATGAEQVYLHEDGITLKDLQRDVELLLRRYNNGKRLGLVIRNEYANDVYDTQFIAKLYEEEGGDVFDVREAILGHLQQGGDPSPFDRSIATRLASRGMEMLVNNVNGKEPESKAIGLQGGHIISIDIEDMPKHVDMKYHRPKHPWWHRLKEIFEVFAFYDKY
jgi:6-phosphofructokinase 1